MNILVTGCFGFIGRNLIDYLNSNSCNTFGIGRNSSKLELANCISADLNLISLNDYLSNYGVPDVIYHLTGGSTVGAAISKPLDEFSNTVSSTVILLDWVRVNCPNSRVIISSSAAVYGINESRFLKEEYLANPLSNYGYYKFIIEKLSEMYVRNYNLRITCTRIFSVYGEGLKKQLLWDVCSKIKNANKGDVITCFGTGNEFRDWIHINDVCKSLFEISKLSCPLMYINIGTGLPHTVSYLVNSIAKHWFSDSDYIKISFNNQVRDGDPFSLVSDNSLKKSLCGHDDIKLDDGIRRYVSWYKAFCNDL